MEVENSDGLCLQIKTTLFDLAFIVLLIHCPK